jgi:hypothetical protein
MDAARSHRVDSADTEMFALPGIDVLLPARLLHQQPQMCRLVAEDAALVFETEEWASRRPRWWRLRASWRWLEDGAALDRRRADLRTFVAAYRADRGPTAGCPAAR